MRFARGSGMRSLLWLAAVASLGVSARAQVPLYDYDNDGTADVLVEEPGLPGGPPGRVEVLSGVDGAKLLTLEPPGSPKPKGDLFGLGAAVIDDLDGDGYREIAVPAPGHEYTSMRPGRIYIYDGNSGAHKSTLVPSAGTYLSWNVTGMGDLNEDGIPDILVQTVRQHGGYLVDGWAVFSGVSGAELSSGLDPESHWKLLLRHEPVVKGKGKPKGDINRDGLITIDDFSLMASRFGEDVKVADPEDLEASGKVDLQDVGAIANRLGTTITPQEIALNSVRESGVGRNRGHGSIVGVADDIGCNFFVQDGRIFGYTSDVDGGISLSSTAGITGAPGIKELSTIPCEIPGELCQKFLPNVGWTWEPLPQYVALGQTFDIEIMPAGRQHAGVVTNPTDYPPVPIVQPLIWDLPTWPTAFTTVSYVSPVVAVKDATGIHYYAAELPVRVRVAHDPTYDTGALLCFMGQPTQGYYVPEGSPPPRFVAESLLAECCTRPEIVSFRDCVAADIDVASWYESDRPQRVKARVTSAENNHTITWQVIEGAEILDLSATPLVQEGEVFTLNAEEPGVVVLKATVTASTPEVGQCQLERFAVLRVIGDCKDDLDGDGVPECCELEHGTDPFAANDWANEVDTDGDSLADALECALGSSPLLVDTDGDDLDDAFEQQIGTDPAQADTDNDGLSDGFEIDVVGTDPLIDDMDQDGLSDGQEHLYFNTDPFSNDSDADGYPDGDEVYAGSSPSNPISIPTGLNPDFFTDPTDSDDDGLPDEWEEIYRTDPWNPDTDNDGVSDADEIAQGSDPRNGFDEGEPPQCQPVYLDVMVQDVLRYTYGWTNEYAVWLGRPGDYRLIDETTFSDTHQEAPMRVRVERDELDSPLEILVTSAGCEYERIRGREYCRGRFSWHVSVASGPGAIIPTPNLSHGVHSCCVAGTVNRGTDQPSGRVFATLQPVQPDPIPLTAHLNAESQLGEHRSWMLLVPGETDFVRFDKTCDDHEPSGTRYRIEIESLIDVNGSTAGHGSVAMIASAPGMAPSSAYEVDQVPTHVHVHGLEVGTARVQVKRVVDGVLDDRVVSAINVAVLGLEVMDIQAFGPTADGAVLSFQTTFSDPSMPSHARVRGAITDGAAACVVRLLPPDLPELATRSLGLRLNLRGGFPAGAQIPRQEVLGTLWTKRNMALRIGGDSITASLLHDNQELPPLPVGRQSAQDPYPEGESFSAFHNTGMGHAYMIFVPPASFNFPSEDLGFTAENGGSGHPEPSLGQPAGTSWHIEEFGIQAEFGDAGVHAFHNSFSPFESKSVGNMMALRRPPIVFVHGLFGNATDYWADFIEDSSNTADNVVNTQRVLVDYKSTNKLGYAENLGALAEGIADARQMYTDGTLASGEPLPVSTAVSALTPTHKYAIARVDVLGHSMGGQIARLYLTGQASPVGVNSVLSIPIQRVATQPNGQPVAGFFWQDTTIVRSPSPNYSLGEIPFYFNAQNLYAGEIRRFIAIGSPFNGSTIADIGEYLFRPRYHVPHTDRFNAPHAVALHEFLKGGIWVDHSDIFVMNFAPESGGPHHVSFDAADIVMDWEEDGAVLVEKIESVGGFRIGQRDGKIVEGTLVQPTALFDLKTVRGGHDYLRSATYPAGRYRVRWAPIATRASFDGEHIVPQKVKFLDGRVMGGILSWLKHTGKFPNDFEMNLSGAESDYVVHVDSQRNRHPGAPENSSLIGVTYPTFSQHTHSEGISSQFQYGQNTSVIALYSGLSLLDPTLERAPGGSRHVVGTDTAYLPSLPWLLDGPEYRTMPKTPAIQFPFEYDLREGSLR